MKSLFLAVLLASSPGIYCQAASPHPMSSETQAKRPVPLQRTIENNGVAFDFFIAPANLLPNATDTSERLLLVKFRIRIPGTSESPFRYKLGVIEDYEKRVKFYAFEFNNNITLYQDGALAPITGYSLDANLNAAPFETFMAAFRLEKSYSQTAEDLHLQVVDPILSQGTIDLVIKKEELQ